MTEVAYRFEDSAAYERFMARWSRAAGAVFLDWLAPPAGLRWLDVGCGTGAFTQLILDTCAPSAVSAIDPAMGQIYYAKCQPFARQADFQAADAQALPFPDATFDVVVSALVINFVPDPAQALREMRRVLRPDGIVAGYVWDFAAEGSPSWPWRAGLRDIGADVPAVPGTAGSTLPALHAKFESAGFHEVATTSIEVTLPFPDFESFWQVQTPAYSPLAPLIDSLSPVDRDRLAVAVRAVLPFLADGSVALTARANAVKARAPVLAVIPDSIRDP